MLADEIGSRSAHRGFVERAVGPAHPSGEQRRSAFGIDDDVAVMTPVRGKAGVKILTDRLRPAHGDIDRQMGIGAEHPGTRRALRFGVEMNHLPGAHGHRYRCDWRR